MIAIGKIFYFTQMLIMCRICGNVYLYRLYTDRHADRHARSYSISVRQLMAAACNIICSLIMMMVQLCRI